MLLMQQYKLTSSVLMMFLAMLYILNQNHCKVKTTTLYVILLQEICTKQLCC